MPAPTIVFDLDGTLVDSAPDLIDTLNLVFAQEGLPPVDFEKARKLVGGGVRAMVERGLRAEGRSCTPEGLEEIFGRFLEHYTAHIADKSRPYPGALDALIELKRRGFVLAVCTNKLERLAKLLIETLGMTPHFAFICGQDTFGVHKPDAAILLKTVAAAKGDPASSIMVGDSDTDVRTALNAKIPVVAVDFGYCHPEVSTFGPDRLISHYNDLPAAIEELLRRR